MPSIGEQLRQAREAIPASLAEASRATRIRVDFLESMERDSFTFISGRVYVVGMLRSYARWLRIDDAGIAAEYDRIYGPPEAPALAESLASHRERTMPVGKPRKPQWAMVGAAAVAILVVLLLFSLIGGGGNVATPPPVPTPTPVASAAAGTPTTATAVAGQGAQLVVAVTGTSSWLHVVAGDTTPQLLEFQGFLNRGVTRTFTAPDLLKVQFGNLGAVRVSVNGTDMGVPGATGQAGAFIVTAGSNALTPDPSSTVPPPSQQTTVSTPRPQAPPSPSASPTPSPTPVASASPSPSPPPPSPTPTATVAPTPTPTATVVSPTAH